MRAALYNLWPEAVCCFTIKTGLSVSQRYSKCNKSMESSGGNGQSHPFHSDQKDSNPARWEMTHPRDSNTEKDESTNGNQSQGGMSNFVHSNQSFELHLCARVDTHRIQNMQRTIKPGASFQPNHLSNTSLELERPGRREAAGHGGGETRIKDPAQGSSRQFLVKEPEFLVFLGGESFHRPESPSSPDTHILATILTPSVAKRLQQKPPKNQDPNVSLSSDALLLGAASCCWLKRQEDVH